MDDKLQMHKLRMRSHSIEFTTREDGDQLIIEGYFSVFNTNYDMGFNMSESIAPGAFTNSMSNDVRALINHDTTLVLGRTSAHTLELREDSHGLWGRINVVKWFFTTFMMPCFEDANQRLP